MARIDWTEDKIKILKYMYINGFSQTKIAKRFDTSTNTIHLKLKGLELLHPYVEWTPEHDEIIRQAYSAKEYTLPEIKGRDQKSIQRRAIKLGLKRDTEIVNQYHKKMVVNYTKLKDGKVKDYYKSC